MVFQVKSGAVGRGDIAKLRGDMAREGAAMATLITLERPTAPMVAEAKAAGHYEHELMGRKYDKIQIVTIREIVEQGKRLEIPLTKDVLKTGGQVVEPAVTMQLPGIDVPIAKPRIRAAGALVKAQRRTRAHGAVVKAERRAPAHNEPRVADGSVPPPKKR
jgi:hypothetical protein